MTKLQAQNLQNLNDNKEAGNTTQKLLSFLNKYMLFIILIGSIITFSILSPYFLTLKNFLALGLTISVIGIVCIGQTLCVLIRGFDLSVGFNAGFCGMVTAYLCANMRIPYIICLLLGLALGGLVGLVNGMLITKGKINPLITTLATGFVLTGGILIVSKGYSIIVDDTQFIFLGTTKILGIPLPIIIMILLFIVFNIILKHTVFGRWIYCMGGNPTAAKIAGINIQKLEMQVYALSGVMAAFGGILLASRMGSAQTSAGSTYSLDSVAASVLGGIALAGGEGKIFGTLGGVAIIGILQNGLVMLGVRQEYQSIATGLVLILAVLLQNMNNKKA
ncbi:ABC transporter permease [Ruminiclostridium cellobioparum]|uniref:Uncharacterized protein n=1 Tax=Ruminiclostridium cellobioparum subsp. termitidis CT1112 TaxID=1195236 RepID=S0FZW2_RUMCE|nr:ABC transporter permease [Ruminiclostridium cellobioparum]EMS74098.1 hypothetical protein CTER_4146 [Ruminiclostridium cellobioparum subsp. termitidis CT1112]